MELYALIDGLSHPDSYPDRPSQVSVRQTHISWLFFTERFVYKLKKSVDFGFLDFTTLAPRKFFCDEEVRLNRRQAPDVYLGVVEVKAHSENSYSANGSLTGASGMATATCAPSISV
jgi:uncharacterized protein